MKKNARPPEGMSERPTKRHCTRRDLFPDTLPPANAPRWPTVGTIKEQALLALMAGPLTQPAFAWSWRLAAYVNDLEADGFAILKRDVQHCGTSFPRYFSIRCNCSRRSSRVIRFSIDSASHCMR